MYCVFADLENAFDRMHKEVVWWTLRKLRADEWLVQMEMRLHSGSVTNVRVNCLKSGEFLVNVGVGTLRIIKDWC